MHAGLDTLSDGATSIREGAGRLRSGLDALSEGSRTIREGVGLLDTGLEALATGTESLREGAETLREGSGTLDRGLGDLEGGSGELNDGAQLAASGAQELSTGTQTPADGTMAFADQVAPLAPLAPGRVLTHPWLLLGVAVIAALAVAGVTLSGRRRDRVSISSAQPDALGDTAEADSDAFLSQFSAESSRPVSDEDPSGPRRGDPDS